MRGVVFDWDQTLWDSWGLHMGGIAHAARTMGLEEPSPEGVAGDIGSALNEHLARLFPDPSRARRLYLEFYQEKRGSLGRLFPGVADLVGALSAGGTALALLSNKERRAGEWELAASGLDGVFRVALFREDLEALKPDPAGLRQALGRLGVEPWDAVYAGDSPVDMVCARRAGVPSAAAMWGCLDAARLLAAEPDLVWWTPPDALGRGGR